MNIALTLLPLFFYFYRWANKQCKTSVLLACLFYHLIISATFLFAVSTMEKELNITGSRIFYLIGLLLISKIVHKGEDGVLLYLFILVLPVVIYLNIFVLLNIWQNPKVVVR